MTPSQGDRVPEGLVEVQATDEGRLDAVVAASIPELSRSRAASLVKAGAVQVDGQVITRTSHSVSVGAQLRVDVPAPVPMGARPQDLPLAIVHEDDDLVVIDKAAGMVVHPGPGHPDGTLVNALLHHVRGLSGIGGVQRPGIVHRLDRGTSGLLVVAKHDQAHQHLAAQFAAHTAERLYLAVVHGALRASAGTVRSHLARHSGDRKRWASTDHAEHGKEAITHWVRRGVRGQISLVQCRLETGRTHQVRVHLTELGYPLLGDPTYRIGGRRPPATIREKVKALGARPLLHAWSLSLDHPRTGERCTWTARLPEDMRDIVEVLELVDALPEGLR